MQNMLQYITLTNLLSILYLIALECILSVDNALALAALVRNRLTDPDDQKHALRYGMIGAYLFRTIVIFAGVWLIHHEWVRWVAGLYLMYLGGKELIHKKNTEEEENSEVGGLKFNFLSPLISTIISVEIMDLMFSVDSIAVSLSISNTVPILVAGAFLGILMMRYCAEFLIEIINKFPILEKTAFILVFLSGLKIVLELCNLHIQEYIFTMLMFIIVGVSLLINKYTMPIKNPEVLK